MIRHKTIGYFVAIIAGFSFGAIPVISAFLRNSGASSIEQTFIRNTIGATAGIGIIIFFYFTKSDEFSYSSKKFPQKTYIFQGFLFSLGIVTYLSSIALETPVGEASLLVQIHPFVTVILGAYLLKEKITMTKVIALILAFFGLLLVTEPWAWESFISSLLGDILAIVNGFLYSIYLIIGAYSNKYRNNISPTLSIAWVLFWGFLTSVPILVTLTLLPLPSQLIAFSLTTVIQLDILYFGILLALFGSIIPYGLIMVSNTFDVESSRQSILMLGEPIGAIFLGALLLSEKITIWYFIGGFSLLSAIVIVIMSPTKNNQE